jgi:hypothetical protein
MLLVKVKLYHGGTARGFATIYFICQKWKFFSIIIWRTGGITPNYCNNHMVYNIPVTSGLSGHQRKIPYSKSYSITQ